MASLICLIESGKISQSLNYLLGGNDRVPVTKLGRLVKDGKIKSIEEVSLFSLPVQEYQIIDILLPKLKGELLVFNVSKPDSIN